MSAKKYSLKNTLFSFLIGTLVLLISFLTIHHAFIDIMVGFLTFVITRSWLD